MPAFLRYACYACISFILRMVLCGGVLTDVDECVGRNFIDRVNTEILHHNKTGLISIIERLHSVNPNNAKLSNCMGVILFMQGDTTGALNLFEMACTLDDFSSKPYIHNFIAAQKVLNLTSTAEVLKQGLMGKKLNTSIPLVSSLIEVYLDEGSISRAYELASNAVLAIPHEYSFWVSYADMLLNAFYSNRIEHVDNNQNRKRIQDTILLGLSLYPRSPSILLLQALEYYYSDNTLCAVHAIHLLNEYRSLSTGVISRPDQLNQLQQIYDVMVEKMGSSSLRYNSSWAERNCIPYQVLTAASPTRSKDHTQHESPGIYVLQNIVGTASDRTGSSLFGEFYAEKVKVVRESLPSLQIGCYNTALCVKTGWVVLDAIETVSVHYKSQAYDLHMVENGSVGVIYSSHTLEHLSHTQCPNNKEVATDSSCDSEAKVALREWRRVLVANGSALISVPDVAILAKFLSDPNMTLSEYSTAMAALFGGQKDPFDFHKNGFTFSTLQDSLLTAGFCDVVRVQSFELFPHDFSNVGISLNVRAKAC